MKKKQSPKAIDTIDSEGNIKQSFVNKDLPKQKSRFLDISSFSIGFYLVTPIVAGVFLGLGLDDYFNTKPALFILTLLLGTIASFYNIYKITKEDE